MICSDCLVEKHYEHIKYVRFRVIEDDENENTILARELKTRL